jgi:membrane-associated phospholipid phosphatase
MRFFSRKSVLAVLILLFLLAFLFGGPENSVDVAMIRQSFGVRSDHPNLTALMIALTHSGSAYVTFGLGGAVTLWLLLRGAHRHALLLTIVVIGERLTMDALKVLIGRPRPSIDAHPVATHSSSFPSGHAANTMAVFLAIALIAAPARYRRHAVTAAVVMSLLVGVTRPYLGVHWPSDVVGGWVLGLIAVWIAIHAGMRSGVLPLDAQHEIVDRHRAEIGNGESA